MKKILAGLALLTVAAGLAGAQPGGVFVRGLEHTPLEGSALSVVGTGETAQVVAQGDPAAGRVGVSIANSSAWGGGASVRLDHLLAGGGALYADYKGWDGTIKGRVSMVPVPGTGAITITGDYSGSGAAVVMHKWFGSTGGQGPVGYTTGITVTPLWNVDGTPPVVECSFSVADSDHTPIIRGTARVRFPAGATLVDNGQVYLIGGIEMRPQLPPGTPVIGDLSRIDISGDGMPDVVVCGARLETFSPGDPCDDGECKGLDSGRVLCFAVGDARIEESAAARSAATCRSGGSRCTTWAPAVRMA